MQLLRMLFPVRVWLLLGSVEDQPFEQGSRVRTLTVLWRESGNHVAGGAAHQIREGVDVLLLQKRFGSGRSHRTPQVYRLEKVLERRALEIARGTGMTLLQQ